VAASAERRAAIQAGDIGPGGRGEAANAALETAAAVRAGAAWAALQAALCAPGAGGVGSAALVPREPGATGFALKDRKPEWLVRLALAEPVLAAWAAEEAAAAKAVEARNRAIHLVMTVRT
jgi:hypothetical protein